MHTYLSLSLSPYKPLNHRFWSVNPHDFPLASETQQWKVPARFQDCSSFSGPAFSSHQSPAPEIETQQMRCWELNAKLYPLFRPYHIPFTYLLYSGNAAWFAGQSPIQFDDCPAINLHSLVGFPACACHVWWHQRVYPIKSQYKLHYITSFDGEIPIISALCTHYILKYILYPHHIPIISPAYPHDIPINFDF